VGGGVLPSVPGGHEDVDETAEGVASVKEDVESHHPGGTHQVVLDLSHVKLQICAGILDPEDLVSQGESNIL
jgi:hypothetical protein